MKMYKIGIGMICLGAILIIKRPIDVLIRNSRREKRELSAAIKEFVNMDFDNVDLRIKK